MTNATPTKTRRVRRDATSAKGPAKAPKTTTGSKPLSQTGDLRAIVFDQYKPEGLVETTIVEQIAKTYSIIQKLTYSFPLDAVLDEYFAGARKLSKAELTTALRESANRDRIISEGLKLIGRAIRELEAYRKSLLNSGGDTVDILTFRLN